MITKKQKYFPNKLRNGHVSTRVSKVPCHCRIELFFKKREMTADVARVARHRCSVVFAAWSHCACRVEQHGIALPYESDASTKHHPLRAHLSRPLQLVSCLLQTPGNLSWLNNLPLYPSRQFHMHFLKTRSQRILVPLSARSA